MGHKGDLGGLSTYRTSDLPNGNFGRRRENVGEESSSERNDTWGLVRVSRACRDHVFDVPLVFVFFRTLSILLDPQLSKD